MPPTEANHKVTSRYSNPMRDSLKTLDCSESRGERMFSKRYSLSSNLSLITQRRRRVEDFPVRTTPPDYLSLVTWTKTWSLSLAVCQTHYNPVGNPFHKGRVESTKAVSATNGGESQDYFKYSNPMRDSLKILDCSEGRGERTVSKRYLLSSSLSLITQGEEG